MAFSDFDLKTAVHRFGLTQDQSTDLFAGVEPLEPSEFLRGWLSELAPIALGINSAQARREYVTTPILVEAMRRAGTKVNVLPGVPLEVDKEKGLVGFCDYLMARSPQIYCVQAPVLAVVEAKEEI